MFGMSDHLTVTWSRTDKKRAGIRVQPYTADWSDLLYLFTRVYSGVAANRELGEGHRVVMTSPPPPHRTQLQ